VFVYYVPDPTKVEAVTHSDGTFHLSEINTSPKFDCKLVAVHPDYLRGESIVVKPKPGETLEGITIKLKDGLFFRGSVQDQSGKPIAGATIKVTFFGNQAIRTVYFGNLLTPIPRDTTDEKGQFNITQMTAGRARVEVTAEDYISLQEMIEVPESGGIEGKVFKMEKGYSISGRVMNAAGKGIGNVRLHASCPHPVSSYSNALTNQEGYYKVTNLKQGIFSLTARMSGYAQAVKEGVQSGELKADFILHENGKLSGMVTSAIDGGPVKEFHINLQTRKGDGTYQWYRDFSHNVKDGKYTCADIEPGVYKVTVRSKEFASKSYDGVTITTGGETTGINFVLSAGCIIFGKVTDAMGSLVKDVHVTAQPLDNRGNPDYQGQSRTDRVKKNGNYRIRGLKSGIYMVKPMAGGYCQSPGQRVQVGGDQAFQVDLILNKGGYISVKVVDARRQPVANAHVLITDSGGNKWGAVTEQYHTPGGGTHMDPVHARVAGEEAGGGGDIATGGGDGMAAGGFGNRTGMTGEFKLAQPLCPGPAVVKVTSPGYQPKERKVTIVDEQQIQCRIVLRK